MTAKRVITSADRQRAEKEVEKKNTTFRYDTRDLVLDYIRDRMEKKIFYIPNYQRKYVWSEKQKSYFIESLFLGLPIPIIFLGVGKKRGRYEIIDGLQRMTTVKSFIDGEIVLQGLEKLPSLNGFSFADLSPMMQEEFKNLPLRTVVLYQNMSKDVIRDLFKRINTTSKILTEFEIIKGTSQNQFIDMVEEFIEDEDFCSVTPFSQNQKKKMYSERGYLLLRFFVFLDHYQEVKNKQREYLSKFVDTVGSNLTTEQLETYRRTLRNVLAFVKKYFGATGFGKSKNQTTRLQFEALSVGIALALRKKPDLKSSPEIIQKMLLSKGYKEVTPSGASANSGKLIKRIEYVRDFLLNNEQ